LVLEDARVPVLDLARYENGEERRYITPDGKSYPSMTTVLGIRPKDGLEKWKERVGPREAEKIGRQAANFGKDIHKLCEEYILHELNRTTHPDYSKLLMPIEYIAFKQLLRVLKQKVSKIYGIELPLYSDELETAGTSDLVCQYQTVNAILDFKALQKPKKREWIDGYFMQGAGYGKMVEERYGIEVPLTIIALATPHGVLQIFCEKNFKWLPKFLEVRELYRKEKENVKLAVGC